MTTQEWTTNADGEQQCGSLRAWNFLGNGRRWLVTDGDMAMHETTFAPSVVEARAVLGMPATMARPTYGSCLRLREPYTREAVHAFMAAEAARSGEPEPEWPEWVKREHAEVPPGWHARVTVHQALRDEAAVDITTPCGFTVQGFVIHEGNSGIHCMRWCVGHVARSRGLPDPYAPAPVQPVEPRPLRVGDRVRHRMVHYVGTVLSVVDGVASVDWDGRRIMASPVENLTLVTPAPEEPACDEVFVPDGHATPAGVVTRAGIVNDVFGVYVRPAKPRPYDEGGTNPAGFPVMPEPRAKYSHCAKCGYVDACECTDEEFAGTASVVLPFDAWLAARERAQQEPEPYDPREGDEVEVHVGDAPNYTGVFARFSEDGDFVVRYLDHDGHERSVSVDPYYVTLVRRPGGVR